MNAALLIMDPQNDFFGADNPNLPEFLRVVPRINEAAAYFRANGWPVIFLQDTSPSKRVGTGRWAIYRDFDCRDEDARLTKTHADAFWHTGLDLLLSCHDVGALVIAGFLSERCVLATYRQALELDYQVALLSGGIASLDNRNTEQVLDAASHISLDQLYTGGIHVFHSSWPNSFAPVETEVSTAGDWAYLAPVWEVEDNGGYTG